MQEDEEIRLMVLEYYLYNEEEKNIFWLKNIGKPYTKLSKNADMDMMLTSKLANVYNKCTATEKDILWDMYSEHVQMYCDRPKWRFKFKKRQQLKANLKSLCPGVDQDFYEFIVNRSII